MANETVENQANVVFDGPSGTLVATDASGKEHKLVRGVEHLIPFELLNRLFAQHHKVHVVYNATPTVPQNAVVEPEVVVDSTVAPVEDTPVVEPAVVDYDESPEVDHTVEE